MRIFPQFALAILSVVAARAATITITHGYEFPHGDYRAKSWTLPAFDASLGELQYVEYFASGSLWADYEFTSMISPGAFSVNVGGFFAISGPGYSFRVDVPTKSSGPQWVGSRGTVSGSVASSGSKSGVFVSNSPFIAGNKGLTLTASRYLPESVGYGTTLVPDVCWHGRVDFSLIYHFQGTTPTPEPATAGLMIAAVPLGLYIWGSRRRQSRAALKG